ncbi:leucine-rich repeat-containing protein 37A-like [Cynocephalus volans]|uniref:leucine-rich repeat-containing protein 37A-like n=1 Tax=Cynocephalus volans TaxID=110931 RepID=UPI002FCB1FFC
MELSSPWGQRKGPTESSVVLEVHQIDTASFFSSVGCFRFLRHRKFSKKNHCQKGLFLLWKPVWLRDIYKPLRATHQKNISKKLHDKTSSDEDERALPESARREDSVFIDMPDEGEESEVPEGNTE